MYLSSHLSTTFSISFFSVEKRTRRQPVGYELLLVGHGSVVLTIGTEEHVLGKNDVILLMPSDDIRLSLLSENYVLAFDLDSDFLNRALPAGGKFFCNSAVDAKADYRELVTLLEALLVSYSDPERELLTLGRLYELLDYMKDHFVVFPEIPTERKKSAARAEELRSYIEENYHLPLTMEKLSAEFYLSPQYLSRIFREEFSASFHKYLAGVRLRHAVAELLGTDHTVTEITFNNGFPSSTAFYKLFRETYGASPAAYRTAHREDTVDVTLSEQLRSLLPEGTPETETLTIRFADASPRYALWSDTINLGPLSNALSNEFHTLFAEAAKHLRFRYARFTNLFAPEFLTETKDDVKWHFTKVDRIFDLLMMTRTLPFFELGMKPDKVSLPGLPEDAVLTQAAEPALSVQLAALDSLLRHCMTRYGREVVSSWRFELWARHDEELQYLDTPEEYAARFLAFSEVIHGLLPDASFGGPGYNAASPQPLFTEYLLALAAAGAKPSFLSIYIYCYEPMPYHSTLSGKEREVRPLSADPEFAKKTFEKYRENTAVHFPDVPLYVTEFNSGLNGFNLVAASTFQSAFLCRNLTALLGETDCVAYWYFADMLKSSPLHPRRLIADMGLYNRQGLPKPSFYAFSLLGSLHSHLLKVTDRVLAATNLRSIYQVLLVHYIHYNRNYCFTYHNRIGLANTYDVFETDTEKKLTLIFPDLPAGRYRMTRHRLNRAHGSLLDVFIGMIEEGRTSPADAEYLMTNMQKEDVDYYAGTVVPLQEIQYLDYDGETPLSRDLRLEPHEVTLVTFERKV